MSKVTLYNDDCLNVLKNIPDESIDLILCDLPYQETGNKWDKGLDLKELFKEYERIIKEDGAIVLTGTFKFGVLLYNTAPHLYKYDWVWEKEQWLREKIKEEKWNIKYAKNVLTTEGEELFWFERASFYNVINFRTRKLGILRHELNRLKGNEEVVPKDVTLDSFVIGYCQEGFGLVGVCSCGKHLVEYKHNYCPVCGRKILWKRVK